MIKIIVKDNKITISGHAKYADAGYDIVCASVSSIIYTTINAALRIDKDSIEFNDDGKTITIINLKKDFYTNCLIDNLHDLFKQLVNDYPKNIKMESEE